MKDVLKDVLIAFGIGLGGPFLVIVSIIGGAVLLNALFK